MTEPFLEDWSLASEETQKRVADLEWRLAKWRIVRAHEHRMALAAQNDNAYHISGHYAVDRQILDKLRRYAEEA